MFYFKYIILQILSILTIPLVSSCAVFDQTRGTSPISQNSKEIEKTPEYYPDSEERTQDLQVPITSITSYFETQESAAAALALSENRLSDALVEFDRLAQALSCSELSLRASFLASYLAYYTGNDRRALFELPKFATKLPVLAPVAFEVAALAAFRLEEYEKVLKFIKNLTPSITFHLLEAETYFKLGEIEKALDLYRKTETLFPSSDRNQEARAQAVKCIDLLTKDLDISETSDSALIKEGLAIIILMGTQDPDDQFTRQASEFEDVFLERLGQTPPARPKENREAERLFGLAQADMQRRRHKQAQNRLNQVLKLARKGGDLECKANYELALAVSNMRDHGQAATLFGEASKVCNIPRLHIRALFRAGRSSISAGRHQDAINYFALVEELYPSHSFADDARLHRARAYLTLENSKKFIELLESLPDLYPQGDMRSEALWLASKWALDNEDWNHAKKLLEKYFKHFPAETNWYTAGRSGYWLGRVNEILGNDESAMQNYEYVISVSPFSYYMLLAHARLRKIDPEKTTQLINELIPRLGQEIVSIRASVLNSTNSFSTGLELVRLGLVSRGRRLIRETLSDSHTDSELHRIAAAIFRQLGNYSESSDISSSLPDGWNSRYPVGDDYSTWTLAYPKAFEKEVEYASNESQIPKPLIYAVMREESRFNPKIESWANAVGLMQLILPTARSMGKELDIRVNRNLLENPLINVRLGTAYLSRLENVVGNHPALMIAGYNAGEGAAGRWRRNNPKYELDFFVENIPFSQTRGYTKRVLSTYGVYNFLYDENREILPLEFNF